MNYEEVLKYWFHELTPAQWWKKDPELDVAINERFHDVYNRASLGELYQWRDNSRGRLAEIIVLDQFSRNMFRGTAQAFATDSMALALAQEAIRVGDDMQLSASERSFLYMPFMHSESIAIHTLAEQLFADVGIEGNINSARQHFDIIKRFGRYPHRNQLLWRDSTEEEMDYLEEPGAGF
ncbi:MAG: hypothetical protein OFPI_30360 [Osedax symbiont Rs2]|nr:MAG: hypothetical protein OFPI_30360 [Osedax symbiont Rs2]